MVLLIFRLNKVTGTEASFVLGKTMSFHKAIFKGYTKEHAANLADDADGIALLAEADLPIYLQCNLFGKNEVCFYQGRNEQIIINDGADNKVGSAIPLGGTKSGRNGDDFKAMNLVLIDRPTTYAATQVITFSLIQIQQNLSTVLTDEQAFGVSVTDHADANDRLDYDHGINLYFEFQTSNDHDVTQSFAIADATDV